MEHISAYPCMHVWRYAVYCEAVIMSAFPKKCGLKK